MNIQTNAALHQDVMAIGVNYRLGAWGWFYLNEKEDDQEWQGKGSVDKIVREWSDSSARCLT